MYMSPLLPEKLAHSHFDIFFWKSALGLKVLMALN